MSWNDVIGHETVKRLLTAHLKTGRVANAYLFAGREGIGKRRLALEMAKALNCEARTEEGPCDACSSCTQMARRVHPDLHVLIPTGASEQISIDTIRHMLSRVALRPYRAKVQVVLLNGAERLTEEAANSVLKTLEEPSATTCFLLITSQVSACLPTIVSRCQLLACSPLPAEAVERILISHETDPKIASEVAQLSDGSVSRALELAERWTDRQPILARCASETASAWLDEPLPETRQEVDVLLEEMIGWLRDVAVAASGGPSLIAHTQHLEALNRQAKSLPVDRCARTAFELMQLRDSLEQFVSPKLVASLAREHWLILMKATHV